MLLLASGYAHTGSKTNVLQLPFATETARAVKIVQSIKETYGKCQAVEAVKSCSQLHLLNAGVNSICFSRVTPDINRCK